MSVQIQTSEVKKIVTRSVIKASEETVMRYLTAEPLIETNKRALDVDDTLKFKDYQEHDLYNVIYQPVMPQIIKKTTWARFLKRLTKTEDFAKLRLIASGDPSLSAWATARIMKAIVEKLKKYVDKVQQQPPQQPPQPPQPPCPPGIICEPAPGIPGSNPAPGGNGQNPQPGGQGGQGSPQPGGNGGQEPTVQEVLDNLGHAEFNDVVNNLKKDLKQIEEELEDVKEYQDEIEDLASMLGGAGGNWFSHDALSLQKFLEKPDEVRKRIRMLRQALTWMRKFNDMISEPKQGSQQSDYFGVKDIAKMSREAQLSRVLSSELAYLAMPDPVAKLMFFSKYTSKELLVYKGYGMSRIVMFIDKSGSMADRLDTSGVPKISIATGLGLAILQKFKDDAKLYMFDTEVDEVNKSKAIDTLLRIQADGGTNISNVLEEIKKNDDKSTLYLIISDGIDEVDADLDESLKKRIVVFLLNTGVPEWIRKLGIKYYDIRSVADFEHAVKETFSS